MKGSGHAILSSRNLVNDEAFGVILADDLCLNNGGPTVTRQMADLFRQFRCTIVAVMEVPDDQIHNYGVVSGSPISDQLIKVQIMIEKPSADEAPSNLAVIGRYILTPDILNDVEPGKGGEIQLTDGINQQAQYGCVIAYKFDGRRLDCGSMEGYVEDTNFYYENY